MNDSTWPTVISALVALGTLAAVVVAVIEAILAGRRSRKAEIENARIANRTLL